MEMMDRRIAVGWDTGMLYKVLELRNEALKDAEIFEKEYDAFFWDDEFSDDGSFFGSDDGEEFRYTDVFYPNIDERRSNSSRNLPAD